MDNIFITAKLSSLAASMAGEEQTIYRNDTYRIALLNVELDGITFCLLLDISDDDYYVTEYVKINECQSKTGKTTYWTQLDGGCEFSYTKEKAIAKAYRLLKKTIE